MLNYHTLVWILSVIYVRTKIVEMMTVGTYTFFSAKLGQICCSKLLINDLQDCYETEWGVRLPYGNVHIARNKPYIVLLTNNSTDCCLELGVLEMVVKSAWSIHHENCVLYESNVHIASQCSGTVGLIILVRGNI